MKSRDYAEEGDLDRPLTPIVSEDDIDHWFKYHPPREGQRVRYEMLREQGRALAHLIAAITPPGPDQMAAIRKIREAIMTANASIACEGEIQTAYYARKLRKGPDEDEGGK
jgi:hypothetical protein